jgi:hypothetical protein
MRIRIAVAAAAAAAMPLATLALGGSASAATSCTVGISSSTFFNCLTPFNQEFGTDYVLDVYQAHARVGQPIILFKNSTHDGAEDFSYYADGTVDEFYSLGLVSPGVELHYSGDIAFEAEYTPYGRPTNLCVGLPFTARRGTPVVLEPCGSSSKVVWIADGAESNCPPTGEGLPDGYVPMINGSDTNFTHPFVLNYPGNGVAPWDRPRPVLNTHNLSIYSDGTVFDNQMWGLTYSGPQQAFPPPCSPFLGNP